ncbi:hypothetical protein [Methylicorpusculum sp.]|uniref:hypothetical protein n=1 Tax=Methylicorpusculum sp. TaxID=2713644 RepID=UPI002ABBEB27|nr:hypothetical protein [Methylicorpusculum sp.]MDZ4153264.1 hypothetical protein [Methylicorpusculum sp.]
MSELEAWSTNNEDFNYSSLEELIDSNSGELAVGQRIYVRDGRKPKLSEICDADAVIELMQNRGLDIGGEYADSFMDDVSVEAKQELDDLLKSWMQKHVTINFYTVHDAREYVLTSKDLQE